MESLKESLLRTLEGSYSEEEYLVYESVEDIDEWLNEYCDIDKYTINSNNTVDVKGDVFIREKFTGKQLPVNFNKVDGEFGCSHIKNLETLKGCPKTVVKQFNCSYCNNLKSLEGAPQEVGISFLCSHCMNLTSLEGAPKEVGKFACNGCEKLTSLEGAPKEVEVLNCSECKNLKSLKGCPKTTHEFVCAKCPNLDESEIDKYKSSISGKIKK